MTKIKTSYYIILVVAISTSCGDVLERDYKEKTSNIIFDYRKTYQSRELINKAISPNQISNGEIDRLFQSTMLSTGSARLYYQGVYEPQNNCQNDSTSQINGSSQLVSPDRLSTAHHNISNASVEVFSITFDGSNTSGFWFSDEDYAKDEEENPLLSNRLWQIGLESWAINSKAHRDETRRYIRNWTAVLDIEGYDSAGTKLTNQPFTSNQEERLDISFLRVKELDNPNFTSVGDPLSTPFYIKSGSFRLRYPGLFFNQTETDSVERKVKDKNVWELLNATDEGFTKLQLLSTPPWVDRYLDTIKDRYAVTACVSGLTNKLKAGCAQEDFCVSSVKKESNYVNCINTSLDSVKGSSGGALMIPGAVSSETSDFYGFTEAYRYNYGVLNGSTETGVKDGWKSENVVMSSNGMPNEYSTFITLGNGDYKEWGKRSYTFDESPKPNFFTPSPKQPESDGQPQCENIPNVGCVYSSVVENEIWGTPEQGAPIAKYPVNINVPSNTPDTGASGLPVRRDKKTVRLQCNYGFYNGEIILKEKFRTEAGMAIGFVGTATDEYPNEKTSVASLGIVCAPWSTASWSENWYWLLRHMRRTWDNGSDTAKSDIWQPVLRLALPFMYEWRKERESDQRILRPMSMKTCPPNYILNGLGLFHDNTKLIGLSKLICQNNNKDILEVNAKPLQGPVGVDAWNYEIRDKLFTMDQRIGNPYSTKSYKEVTCPDNKIVAGVQITESSDGAVESFHLECMKAPGSL